MALRQGSGAALRFLSRQHGGSTSVLSAAAGGSRSAMSGLGELQGMATVGAAPQAHVAQFSAATAAALAKRQAHLGAGSSAMTLGSSARTFASSGAVNSPAVGAPAAAAAAAATATKEAGQKTSILSRFAQAAAVLMGTVLLATTTANADSPEPWQWLFQDTATSTGQAMQDLHHDIMFFLITISVVVLYLIGSVASSFHYSKQIKPEKLTHHTTLEVIWTVIPTIIVLSIAVPSLTLIYSLDQHADRPGLTVKVIGRQWYWSYEMHDHLQQKLLDPDRLVAIAEKSVLKA